MAECTYHDNLLLIQGDFLRNLLDGLFGVHHGLVLVLGVDGAGHFGWQAGCRGCGVVAGWVSWGVSGNAETWIGCLAGIWGLNLRNAGSSSWRYHAEKKVGYR
jgi:hypothetical protein